jgi:hypothetical protein
MQMSPTFDKSDPTWKRHQSPVIDLMMNFGIISGIWYVKLI